MSKHNHKPPAAPPAPPPSAPQAPPASAPAAPLLVPQGYDPVEAAKVAAAEVPVDDATMHAPGLQTPPVPAPFVAHEPAVEAPIRVKPGAAPVDTSGWKKAPVWRVIKGGNAQIRGQRQSLAVGKLLDEGSYGPSVLESLREQGIELELAEGSVSSSDTVNALFKRMAKITDEVAALSKDEQDELHRLMDAEQERRYKEARAAQDAEAAKEG